MLKSETTKFSDRGIAINVNNAPEKIINGASLVQLYTGMIYQGPSIATKISEELINILEKEGVKNISDIVGSKN